MIRQCLLFGIFILLTGRQGMGQEVLQQPAGAPPPVRSTLSATPALPRTISYQGLLTMATGTPAPDGNYSIRFDLYDTLAGGISKWSTIFGTVPILRGTFSVVLDTISLPLMKQYYVQLTAISGPAGPSYPLTFSPRSQLTGAPYALAPWIPTGNDLYYSSGNVGIGTTTPAHRLSIGGGPSWTSNFWKGAVDLENASAISWQANAAGQRFGIGHTNQGLFMFRTLSDPGTTVSPAEYSVMIDDSGNVAIEKGSLLFSPLHRFHVTDSLSMGLGWPGYRAGSMTFYPPDNSTWYHIDNPGGEGLRISGGVKPGVNDYMTIVHPGNVGIGTMNPAHQLHIANAGDVLLRIDPQGTNRAGQVEFYRGGDAFSWVGPAASNQFHLWSKENIPIVLAQNNLERMRVDTGGNVGIGTYSPQTLLHVAGDVTADAYTKLGTDAPAIRMKKITGTTSATQGATVLFPHGLTDSKILSVSVMVSYTGAGGWIEPGYNLNPGYEYYWYDDNTGNIRVRNTTANSGNILSAPLVILITYEE
jgi:hypothetical protein